MMKRFMSGCVAIVCAGAVQAATLFVETESFADKGGAVVDQQFMDQMGSPFLMAHGLGAPVADATTTIEVPERRLPCAGTHTQLGRTLDAEKTRPAKFQVSVNGVRLPTVAGHARQ